MLPKFSFGQHFFRIEGDITIKEKGDLQSQLTIGKFYYDKNIGKLVYNLNFPEKQTLVSRDTVLYVFSGDSLVNRTKGFDMTKFSIFNLSLENQLNNYGLEKSFYNIEKVENEGGMVISTWAPGKTQQKHFGNVIISVKDNRLYGIVFMNPAGEVVGKQFFEDYTVVNGLAFPKQMVKFAYMGDKKSTQVTTFDNIKVNNLNEKYYYDYPLPAH
ncbi:MAG: hypothetical protein JXB00_18305 [Bacteroidales bacterium]|nr:hypothetical protein [Bacteroidales bacterium]